MRKCSPSCVLCYDWIAFLVFQKWGYEFLSKFKCFFCVYQYMSEIECETTVVLIVVIGQ